jgi:hypothetical protein
VVLESLVAEGRNPPMASQISSLLLVVLLLIGCSFSQEAGDVQIDITFNPCTFKVCKEGEKCRVVVQSKLLEVPIGVCVKEKNKVKSSFKLWGIKW